jgi:hypothetical protein
MIEGSGSGRPKSMWIPTNPDQGGPKACGSPRIRIRIRNTASLSFSLAPSQSLPPPQTGIKKPPPELLGCESCDPRPGSHSASPAQPAAPHGSPPPYWNQCCGSVIISCRSGSKRGINYGSYLDIFVVINKIYCQTSSDSKSLKKIKCLTFFLKFFLNLWLIVRIRSWIRKKIRIRKNRIMDPDPGGQLITDSPDTLIITLLRIRIICQM